MKQKTCKVRCLNIYYLIINNVHLTSAGALQRKQHSAVFCTILYFIAAKKCIFSNSSCSPYAVVFGLLCCSTIYCNCLHVAVVVAVCVSHHIHQGVHPSHHLSFTPQDKASSRPAPKVCPKLWSKEGKLLMFLLIPPRAIFGIKAPNIFLIITSSKIIAYSSLHSCNHLQQKFNLKITTKIKVVETIWGNKGKQTFYCKLLLWRRLSGINLQL